MNARAANEPTPHVLIIAAHKKTRRELERALPDPIPRRSVASALETEGLGSRVVVVGGDFPLAQLTEVRAHPVLSDKPVVLFAPSNDLPEVDWQAARVWPVLEEHNALGQLIGHVRDLMAAVGHDVFEWRASPAWSRPAT